MNRRNALSHISLLLGSTLSAPTLLAMNRRDRHERIPGGFTLTSDQRSLVATVAELIIPKTDTPGAIEAGVPAFIEMMLQDCYLQPEHQSFVAGVEQLQQAGFLSQSTADQTETLRRLEAETKELMKAYQVQQTKMGDNEDKELMKKQATGLPFWRLMKELTLLGYFTSEAGLQASFNYVPIPGKYELIKIKPGQKVYAY